MKFFLKAFYIFLVLGVVYIGSVLWRVSVAEKDYFGRSDLIPLSANAPKYNKKPTKHSFGSKTFVFSRDNGKAFPVWKQEINGFQHVYGSALTAFELGEKPSDWLFCGNEFMEAFLDWDGIQNNDFRDRRKDLQHNRLGRGIGLATRKRGLRGAQAEHAMIQAILKEMETANVFIHHYRDPRVDRLPSEAAFGCPGLPSSNLFNYLQAPSNESSEEGD